MNKKSIKLTSKDIIIKRDQICKDKTRYWKIIKSENVMSKKDKKAGMGSGCDLAALHNTILQNTETLIKIKLMLNCINNGITTFNYEEAKKTHYYTIYRSSELKEQLAHWDEILNKHTINPVAKKKAGAKGLSKTETFSVEKITSIKKKLTLEINKLNEKIVKFNEDTTLEVTDDDIANMFTV